MRFGSIDFKNCSVCGKEDPNGQYWTLRKYYGVSGRLCQACYAKVAHDAYGKPRHPEQHRAVLVQQQIEDFV